jgi:hypothetical protein
LVSLTSCPFEQAQRIGQRHLAVLVVMAVGLAIGGHMHQLWLVVPVFEAGLEARGECLAGVEQPFKGDGARDWAVVEEDGDRCARRKAHKIGTRGIDVASGVSVQSTAFNSSGRMRLH